MEQHFHMAEQKMLNFILIFRSNPFWWLEIFKIELIIKLTPSLAFYLAGSYTTHNLVCRMALTSFDQIPDDLHTICQYAYVEFTMPATQVSHTTVRSVSISNSDSDVPPEKYVRHLARHEYR